MPFAVKITLYLGRSFTAAPFRCLQGWSLPAFADIDPTQTAGGPFQFVQVQLNGAGSGTGGRIDNVKAFERNVQINGDSFLDPEGTYPADPMADDGLDLFKREHGCLGVKSGFELGVIDFGISGGHDKDRDAVHPKGEGLCDAGGLTADGLSGQLHGGAGYIKLSDSPLQTESSQMGRSTFKGHGDSLAFFFEGRMKKSYASFGK